MERGILNEYTHYGSWSSKGMPSPGYRHQSTVDESYPLTKNENHN